MIKSGFLAIERYFEPVCIVVLIALMTTVICAQVLMRTLGSSMPQAEEVARLLFVWAMYLSISYAIRDDRHIRISVLIDALPQAPRLFLQNCADLIFLVYSIVVCVFGWQVITRSLELGQIAPATELPVAVIYSSVLIGAILNVLRLGQRLYFRALAKETVRDGSMT